MQLEKMAADGDAWAVEKLAAIRADAKATEVFYAETGFHGWTEYYAFKPRDGQVT